MGLDRMWKAVKKGWEDRINHFNTDPEMLKARRAYARFLVGERKKRATMKAGRMIAGGLGQAFGAAWDTTMRNVSPPVGLWRFGKGLGRAGYGGIWRLYSAARLTGEKARLGIRFIRMK
jgi:hypothetical protein